MDKDAKLKIEYMPIDKLKPYEKNARKHTDFDVNATAASIEQFGFKDPIGIWGKDNTIVAGHGRYLAAKKLGMKEVPVIRIDDLSDKERQLYGLVHNKTAENSSWDFDTLNTEVEELSQDFDVSKFGLQVFDAVNMDDLDSLFTEAPTQEKEPKKIQCPHCGEWFVPEK